MAEGTAGIGGGAAGAAGTASLRDQGMSLMRLQKFGDAAQVLTRAVEAEPQDAMAWQLLGGARASSGNPNGAVEAFRHALALSPTSAKNNYNLALALQAAGQPYDAKNHLERAVALDPNYEQAKAKLAEISAAATNSSYGSGATATTAAPASEGSSVNSASVGGSDGLRAFAVSAPAAPPKAGTKDNTTNIGAGDSAGLAPVGTAFLASSAASAAANEGSTNVGVGSMGGLAGIGGNMKSTGSGGTALPAPSSSPSSAPAAPALSGLGGLGSVGGGVSATMAPQQPATMAPRPIVNLPIAGSSAGPSFAPGDYTAPGTSGPLSAKPVVRRADGRSNSSGTGEPAPPEVAGGFNFGAFGFPYAWLVKHNLILYAGMWGSYVYFIWRFRRLSPYILLLALGVDIVARFFLAFQANRWAWEFNYFDDVEHFKKSQRLWAIIAIPAILFFGWFCFNVITDSFGAFGVVDVDAGADEDEIPTSLTPPRGAGSSSGFD